MKILLKFDLDSHMIYVPDGYIQDIEETQNDFANWLYTQKENWIKSPGGQLALRYNRNDFLRYVNEVILANSEEKAYFVNDKDNSAKEIPVLRF